MSFEGWMKHSSSRIIDVMLSNIIGPTSMFAVLTSTENEAADSDAGSTATSDSHVERVKHIIDLVPLEASTKSHNTVRRIFEGA